MPDTSNAIRDLIIHNHRQGDNQSEIARMLNCTRWTVGRIIRQHQQTGSAAAARRGRAGTNRVLSHTTRRALRRAYTGYTVDIPVFSVH